MPLGLFHTSLLVYDEIVVRELLVNTLVHRPYTQRGDIFINLRMDRHRIKGALEALHDEGAINYQGEKRWRCYSIAGK